MLPPLSGHWIELFVIEHRIAAINQCSNIRHDINSTHIYGLHRFFSYYSYVNLLIKNNIYPGKAKDQRL